MRYDFVGHRDSAQSGKQFYSNQWDSMYSELNTTKIARGSTQLRGNRCNGRRKFRPRSLSRLSMVLVVTCWVVDNHESGTARDDPTVAPSLYSVISLGRPPLSWLYVLPWLTHSCQHRRMVALLRLKLRTIIWFDPSAYFRPIIRLLSEGDKWSYFERRRIVGLLSKYERWSYENMYAKHCYSQTE